MYRLGKQSFKLYRHRDILLKNVKTIEKLNRHENYNQNREFSFQSSVESVAKTQTGIFKWISESTPVEYLQNFLLTMHDTTGLPWWATIVCTTVLLRTCVTLPLAVYQNYILAKLHNLQLEMPAIVEELKKETSIAVKMYNWDEKKAKMVYNRSIRKQWNNLVVRDNCHPFKASLLLWFQIPMWISLSVSLRNLVYMLPHQNVDAQITFTELTVGGFGFIPNLTEVDASGILPVGLGLINLLIIELQRLSKVNEPTKLQKFLTNIFRGLSVIMIPVAASVPSCLVLYWTTSSAYGLIQNLVLMSPKAKRICGIPKTDKELEHPYRHVSLQIQKKLNLSSNTSK
ncbi:cytochrome c oxidase assembly protein COX18, mitochondrial isoform X1 [Diorhabda sublineata]|uniref:cytochrome c oxidase assembly protein COX18, mitochondrial isoform X1 n=2 Tax=Diorhabda sublineata TaxID=1163346 RepID=UPI0024E0E116|nr:cytochrome c oxidase assembly protein COX18, mitochondrial isoform X1 [Diorhabda sublineata]